MMRFDHDMWAELLDKGLSLVPVKMGGGFPGGLSQVQATSNKSTLYEWISRYPDCTMAIAHGGQSGTCAIDLDVGGDYDGVEQLAQLHSLYVYDTDSDDSLETLTISTPSGGLHLIFKHDDSVFNDVRIAPGIDTRGGRKSDPSKNGGITYAPGGPKPTGKSGKPYTITKDLPIREFPPWLLSAIRGEAPSGQIWRDWYARGERDQQIYLSAVRFLASGGSEEDLWSKVDLVLERMDGPDRRMVEKCFRSALKSDVARDMENRRKESERRRRDEEKRRAAVAAVNDGVVSLGLRLTQKGDLIRDVDNLDRIVHSEMFTENMGYVEFDDFQLDFVTDGVPMAARVDWAAEMRGFICERWGVDWPTGTVRERVELMAWKRPHRNVVREYMERVRDEYTHPGAFDELCTSVLGLDDPGLHPDSTEEVRQLYREFIWHWLRSVAARACVPGNKTDMMLIIFGERQGTGKSTFLRNICPRDDWFIDSVNSGIFEDGSKFRDELWKMQGKLIVEFQEMNAVIKVRGKSGDERIKDFITQRSDKIRYAYGRDMHTVPRTFVLSGTSNKIDIYRDASGSRRFLSVWIERRINNDLLTPDLRDAVWGEVMHSFDSVDEMAHVMLPEDLWDKQSDLNEQLFTYDEPGIDDVVRWMSDKTRVRWGEIESYVESSGNRALLSLGGYTMQLRLRDALKKKYQHKKQGYLLDENGERKKANYWVNPEVEARFTGGSPPHWSEYAGDEPRDEY